MTSWNFLSNDLFLFHEDRNEYGVFKLIVLRRTHFRVTEITCLHNTLILNNNLIQCIQRILEYSQSMTSLHCTIFERIFTFLIHEITQTKITHNHKITRIKNRD